MARVSASREERLAEIMEKFEQLYQLHSPYHWAPFSQRAFLCQLQCGRPFGVCAGLIVAWWNEKTAGRNALEALLVANRQTICTVLLAQARSIYWIIDGSHVQSDVALAMLKFKYGLDSVALLQQLMDSLKVTSLRDLDMARDFGLPVVRSYAELSSMGNVVRALHVKDCSLLIVILRFWKEERLAGHRIALRVDTDGLHTFFDPSRGEISFRHGAEFFAWFADYWEIEGWSGKCFRGERPGSGVEVVVLGGEFSETERLYLNSARQKPQGTAEEWAKMIELVDPYTAEWLNVAGALCFIEPMSSERQIMAGDKQ